MKRLTNKAGRFLFTSVVALVFLAEGISLLAVAADQVASSVQEAPAAPAVSAPEPATTETVTDADSLPPGLFTVGIEGGDGYTEGFGDVLIPVADFKNGLIFFAPRVSVTDYDEREINLGVGLRRLFPDTGVIVGGNIYYDNRKTELGSTFNQGGIGLECLSKSVDFRANAYFPDSTETLVSERDEVEVTESSLTSTTLQAPYAQANGIGQRALTTTTTTRETLTRHFEEYERALRGYDAELGFLLPIPRIDDYADVKLFGGYYLYENEYAPDIEGWKARLEIRALSRLYLDGQVFENEDLTGSRYSMGVRFSSTFDVAKLFNGRNPFKGASDSKLGGTVPLESRMTEMVMRDLHVRTEYSGLIENTSAQTTTSSTTQTVFETLYSLQQGVIFVNGERGNDSNPGTYEFPVKTIDAGLALGEDVFVMRTAAGYDTNVVITRDVNLMGQGIPLNAGMYLNGDSRHTLVNGGGAESTIAILGNDGAQNVAIRGFDLRNDRDYGAAKAEVLPNVGLSVISVQNAPVVEVSHNIIGNAGAGILAAYTDNPNFFLSLHNNTIEDTGVGAAVVAMNSSGTVLARDNSISRSGAGIVAVGVGTAAGTSRSIDVGISGNTISGGGLAMIGKLAADDAFMASMGFPSLSSLLSSASLPPEIADIVGDLPADLPSLAGIGVASVSTADDATMKVSAIVTDNTIEDNLIGVLGVAFGPDADIELGVARNTISGGGLNDLVNVITGEDDAPEVASLDYSIAGILAVSLGGSDTLLAAQDNLISGQLLGIAGLSILQGRMNGADIYRNTIANSFVGIAGIGIMGAEMEDWSIDENSICGGGLDALVSSVFNLAEEEGGSVLPTNPGAVGILGVGYQSSMDGWMIGGNTIDNQVVGIGIAALQADFEELSVTENNVDGSLIGILLFGDDSNMDDAGILQNKVNGALAGTVVVAMNSDIDSLYIAENSFQDGLIGAMVSINDDCSADDMSISDNVISGGVSADTMGMGEDVLEFLDLNDEVAQMLGVDWETITSADGGLVGIAVAVDSNNEAVDVEIAGNKLSGHTTGVLVRETNNVEAVSIEISYNAGDAPYIVQGTNHVLVQADNVPAPVIEIP